MFRSFLILLISAMASSAIAQDTDWVQTFTFSDITKRRGTFKTVEKDDYRKVLMYYTLKCDPKTTQDNYNCGEWDYLTYNFLYDHNATFDSTYKSGVNFKANGSTPDKFSYTSKPIYDYKVHEYKVVNRLDTIMYNGYTIGLGADTLQNLIPNENYSNVSQFIYTANDLVQSGLQIGEINSIKIYVTKGAHADLLKIGLKGVTDDTLIWKNRSVDVETHYMQSVNLKEGWVSFPFEKPFAWNGTENILVEFETVNFNNSDKIEILGDVTSKSMGISHGTSSKYLSLDGAGDYVNMGKQAQIDGGKERTIEVWAKTKSFNNGGLFQAGLSGTLRDFTLRTMTGDNKWRIQLWGADGDVTLDESKDNWQHYALVYNGKSTTLYYNGEFIRLKNAELNTPDADLRIGRWQGSFFNGDVDNMRIWESALSADDLKKYASIKVDSLHPDLENLKAVYSFDEKNSGFVQNEIANGEKGVLWGDAWFKNHAAIEDFTQGQNLNARPMLVFENGVYNELTEIREVREPVLRKPTTVELYGNAANGMIIEDDSKKHPSLVTDTLIVWPAGGYSYVYNELTGQKLDSTFIQITGSLQKENKEWYSPTVRYEIGRYITPYGINLTLGKKGFTWVYDVTDYAPLLFDSIDLSAGNQQELIDLKIAFVKGTPTHNVKRIDAIWPFGSYSYKNLDNDVSLKENEIALENDAETFLVRTRLTGHGHNSTDGEFPHCCEWKDNTHYLFVDGNQVADWHIWREDCDLNPVYPQGGNWVGAREGWCPGDVVGDNDFNITDHIKGNTVKLDYDITDVPTDNQGMGNGNYIVGMQLFQYGEANFETDASIEMVKRPTDWEYYQRLNPACAQPIIVVKNTGSKEITSLEIEYTVSGGIKLTHTWNGSIQFLKSVEIDLPIDGSYFWVGDDAQIFTAKIINVNGQKDQNNENDIYSTHFQLPEIIKKQEFFIQLKTNNIPEENHYEIKDATGNVVYSLENLSANTVYRDTISLDYGCYTFELFDEGYGLSYWAWPDQGSGTLQMRYVGGGLIKSFDPDFGEKIYWPFAVGTVSTILEGEYKPTIQAYPNPTSGKLNIEVNNLNERYLVQMVDVTGKQVYNNIVEGKGLDLLKVDLSSANSGVYLLKITSQTNTYSKRVIIE